MKKIRNTRKFFYEIQKIKFIDRFLLVGMIILFCESLASVFLITEPSNIIEHIDDTIRTAMVSIFGYFISASFLQNADMRGQPASQQPSAAPQISRDTDSPDARSAIHAAPQSGEIQAPAPEKITERRRPHASKTQILIVGVMFVCSILGLIIIKYFGQDNDYALLGQMQFKDIACGCVGFLIGIPAANTSE